MKIFCLIVVILIVSHPCWADIVHLNDGPSFEAVAQENGDGAYVIDGVIFEADEIDHIEKKALSEGYNSKYSPQHQKYKEQSKIRKTHKKKSAFLRKAFKEKQDERSWSQKFADFFEENSKFRDQETPEKPKIHKKETGQKQTILESYDDEVEKAREVTERGMRNAAIAEAVPKGKIMQLRETEADEFEKVMKSQKMSNIKTMPKKVCPVGDCPSKNSGCRKGRCKH